MSLTLTTSAKIFIKTPMEKKAVTAVPGVGPACARKLSVKGVILASDLYKIFLACKSNKTRFLAWTNLHCKLRPNDFERCFEAFKQWQIQFPSEYQQSPVVKILRPEGSTAKNTPKGRGVQAPKTKPPKRTQNLKNVSFEDTVVMEGNDAVPTRDDLRNSDPLVSFFLSIRETVQRLPPLKQLQVKNQIYGIVSVAEAEAIQKQELMEPTASTSQNGAGNSQQQSSLSVFKRPQAPASK